MAKMSNRQLLQPSLLDRLIGYEEGGSSPSRLRTQGLRELKEGIRRDLENLLNTRWRCSSWPPNLTELELSLVNYGIPDFTGTNLGSPDSQDDFRQILEQVIRSHEPRFKSVAVKILRNQDPMDRTLRFRIDALVHADPAPEPVVFDSALEPLTASFQVKEGSQ